jgi:hypothetical protein
VRSLGDWLAAVSVGERVAAGVVVVALVAALVVAGDYGVTWDEAVQARYGELVLAYAKSGGSDQRCNDFLNLHYYGPAFETLCAAVYGDSARLYHIRHLLIGLAAVVALALTMAAARAGGDGWSAAAAGVALLMLPRFVGHAFNNSKDIPFAGAYVLALVVTLWAVQARQLRRRHVLSLGAAAGLVLAVRVGGGFVFACMAASVAARVLHRAEWPALRQALRSRRTLLPALAKVVAVVAVAWTLMVVFWPWAHQQPLAGPFVAWRESMAFSIEKTMVFAGARVSSQEVPRTYLLHYLAITTPLPLLVLMLTGCGTMVLALRRAPRTRQALADAVVLIWLLLPLSAFIVLRPAVYDGLRHFLFLLPLFAIAAGHGLCRCVRLLPAGRRRVAAAAVGTLLLLLPVRDLAALHPYQSSYFNPFVGGVAGAAGRYEVDYWASSYREAAQWLNDNAVAPPNRRARVLAAGTVHSLAGLQYYLDGAIQAGAVNEVEIPGVLPPTADYYVAVTRFGYDRNFPGSRVVHEVRRDGAVLAVIRSRR